MAFLTMTTGAVQTTKHVVDGFSVGVLLGAFAGWLPPFAAFLTILWLGMQIVMNWGKFKDAIMGIKDKQRRRGDK